ncbi:Gx transporter family protein [Helcococcus kunzii]|uniref:Gx transporter family protein n=1 Tax=Helcococcus kunzii TaxID=40091 RepID=UPI001BAE7F4C|nr:Gx transporter family protein [Helcococcus kunzii]MCT1795338.1 Gx transporter family protein [Helcococcus kunzii]MCT1989519.1 Gx transporter family protein [Helcococcus kunzii]QUY64593.1 Gx transporter family protein [Helcococcus kunzii]
MSRELRDLVYTALLVAMALAVSLVERLIPLPFSMPGAKLGLSNMVILVTLMLYGFKRGMVVALLKSILLMLIVGLGPSFIYSFAGALLSTITMWISLKYFNEKIKIFSIIGVSIIGAVSHNFAQVTAAAYILKSLMLYTYFPFLTIIAIVTGYFVGLGSYNVASQLKKINKF